MLIRSPDIFYSFALSGAYLMKSAELKIEVPFSEVNANGEEVERSSARKIRHVRRDLPKESRKREARQPLYLSRYE